MRSIVLACALLGCGGNGGDDAPAQQQPDTGVATKGFSKGPALPRAWQEHAVVSNGRGVHVLGGFAPVKTARDVPLLAPGATSWTTAPALPAERHHVMAAGIGDDVYVLGGMVGIDFVSQKTAWVLESGATAWGSLPELPEARGAGGAAAIGGTIYVVGGALGGVTRAEVFALDVASRTWRTVAPVRTPREHLAVVAFEGRVWALAGRQGSLSSNLSTVEIYDPATDAWTDGPSLPRAAGGCAAIVHGGKIYLLGGEAPDVASDELDVFDPATRTWSIAAHTPRPRHGLGLGTLGNAIVIPGGGDKPMLAAIADVDLYVP